MSHHQVGESWHLDDVTDEATDEPIGPRIMHAVHMRSQCGRRPCCLHRPSGHHMGGWPTLWHTRRRMMMRVCEHEVPHPDPDDAAYRASCGDEDISHDCDGCCQP